MPHLPPQQVFWNTLMFQSPPQQMVEGISGSSLLSPSSLLPPQPIAQPKIPFNQPYITGRELEYMQAAIENGKLCGDGTFSKRCQEWLVQQLRCRSALLTHSCTAALEMAAILADVQPGDEVIMPSFTFVSTANAFVLRGAVPVFVDVRSDTLNLDERLVEAAITSRTKAIVPVHYAGVGCEMDTLRSIADEHQLCLIEDAAQGILSEYRGKPLGSWGHLAALSFHETKNIISGEGGALLINDPAMIERAEIIREKGTNRSQFLRGEVDKYTWVDVGSSFLPSDILAAFLFAQLEQSRSILDQRLAVWNCYHAGLESLEISGQARRPIIPSHCQHNGHIYYLLVQHPDTQMALLDHLKANGVQATFHYVPLHSSPAGQKYGRASGSLAVTEQISDRLVRLPLSAGMTMADAERVVAIVQRFFQVRGI